MNENIYFVLKSRRYPPCNAWDGYYIGKTYQFQGEIYSVVDTSLKKAKRYTSYKRAHNTLSALRRKSTNYTFDIFKIVNDKEIEPTKEQEETEKVIK